MNAQKHSPDENGHSILWLKTSLFPAILGAFVAARKARVSLMRKLIALSIILLLFVGTSFLAGCTSSPSQSPDGSSGESKDSVCTEPENPYSDGTAKYKGYEWAEEHGRPCSVSSSEFTEGCEEYDSQEAEYEECQAKKGH